jgi:hypothetical protein
MSRIIQGVVHGRTIELAEDPGVPDGEQVEVVVKALPQAKAWGEGIRRSAGSLADSWTQEDERILEELYLDRKRGARPEIPE